jgi:hypothetical protein
MSPLASPISTLSLGQVQDAVQRIPLVVIPINKDILEEGETHLDDLFQQYIDDDVINRDWLKVVYLVPGSDGQQTLESGDFAQLYTRLAGRGVNHIIVQSRLISGARETKEQVVSIIDNTDTLQPGPYLATRQSSSDRFDLSKVYRLYPDTCRAFVFGVYPLGVSGEYKALRRVDDDGYNLIPVPSSLYRGSRKNDGLYGLRGRRLAIKGKYLYSF